ncbi:MAG: phosphonate C-P lyase system protein PhnG [Pantoea sp.]|uniref:Phosphonate C-P lyase system protein PhnG n=1 Tax=Pantoea phytobeneficialis TaxID=2052056 RepID=A0AAP9KQH5_9GAMM|nr:MULTISPECIES: phosphonate C-P lyase system protein PhnG [Pantoea]ERK17814.1 PhnG protein [Pantoea sp. AS-PWVM4]MDO6409804.1 phosphonate C-P lyase system protein PhnG [Pantoea phytobeneficialis]QGR07903.1 phosphonate C-P lyase system protein PhnG [Pantoea phytobeneficialis]
MKQPTARQNWLSVLAHSDASVLEAHWQPLRLAPRFECVRPAETGLTRLQARMGGSGKRFVMGDATVTRAVVKLHDGTLGFSYVLGRDKAHAERCALIDALLQQPETQALIAEKVIAPLAALREEQRQLRAREIASSKVDFFTLVRGDN